MKKSYVSGAQKRTDEKRKRIAALQSVPVISCFFPNPQRDNPSVLDELNNEKSCVRVSDESPPTADSNSGSGPVDKINIDSQCSSSSSMFFDKEPTAQNTTDAVVVRTSTSNEINNTPEGSSTDPDQILDDEFYKREYPTDKSHFEQLVEDVALKRKIVLYGPCQPQGPFTANESGRKFSVDYYEVTTKTGKKLKREWLCYSANSCYAYCESCWLFADRKSKHFRDEWITGVNDWQHLSQKIRDHQQARYHIESVISHQQWRKSGCVDDFLENQIKDETKLWKRALQRLLDIVLTLAENNLAFRGDREVLGEPHCGNFLALVSLVARYDPVLEELVKKPSGPGQCRYLSPDIQNELIEISGAAVRNKLLKDIRSAPFYSVLADGTQDITKCDQFSCVIRCVVIDDQKCEIEIKESFLGFYHVIDQSAQGIEVLLASILSEIDIENAGDKDMMVRR